MRTQATWRMVVVAALALVASVRVASADVGVYADGLASGWQDWSWGGVTRTFSQIAPVHAGGAAIGVTYTDGWSGLQLGTPSPIDVTAYDSLRFYVHGGAAGGQGIEVTLGSNASGLSVSQTIVPAAGSWTRVDVPLADLGPARQVDYIQWFNATPGGQPSLSLDDVSFLSAGLATPTPAPPSAGPSLTIDVGVGRHAISPYIYGMNFADENLAAELALPIRRFGGNATTRYNWQNDTSNRAADWYFENIPSDNANPSALPDGSDADEFIEQDRRTGTATLLTVPLIGWTPKSRAVSCGFAVSKYGAQQSTDPWQPNCGNGVTPGGTDVTGNDPSDTSVAVTPAFVQEWIAHLHGRYGMAANGGVRFYNLDNEPMLWSDTHRDVHPAPTSYDEMRTRTYAYAAAIKASDPAAQTLGPAEWGWTGYFWSALDWSAGGAWWNAPPDRLAHGNVPFLSWYLQQMRAYEQQHGTRILDYVDLHYYPQAAGVSLSSAGNAATQALRLRSTRALWDATYVDESWIGEPVRLIPRLRDWVTTDYPGTKTAVTEYNWGGLEHVNGALAQADVLGIFGREGLDLATLWSPPTASQPGAYAFRMFRNYDGSGGRFGDVSVQSASTDQSRLAVYGAERGADGALTLMVINKTSTPLTSQLSLAGFATGPAARCYRYDATAPGSIIHDVDVAVSGGAIATTFPAASITLIVVPAGAGASTVTPTGPAATPSATRTRTPTPTATRTATPIPSATHTSTTGATTTRTATPVPSATRTPTPTPSASRTPTSAPTATRTTTPVATASAAATGTATSTRTASATPVATPTATTGGSISGTIRYLGSAEVVPGVTVQLLGGAGALDDTDASGRFAFSGLAADDWQVVPTKVASGAAGVAARDAATMLQITQRLRVVEGLQRVACDVSGDGKISLRDVKLLLEYRVGLAAELPARTRCGGGWVFAPTPAPADHQQLVVPGFDRSTCVPGAIILSPLVGSADGQDFSAAIIGDCANDWQSTGDSPGISGASLTLGTPIATGSRLRIPLVVDAPADFSSVEAVVLYDATELSRPRLRRTASGRRATVAANASLPGRVTIALAAGRPMASGTVALLELRRVEGVPPSVPTLESARVDP